MPKPTAPKAKDAKENPRNATNPEAPKPAADKPAAAKATAKSAASRFFHHRATAASAAAAPVPVVGTAAPESAYVLPQAQVVPQTYSTASAIATQRVLVQPTGQPSQKAGLATVTSGISQRAISTGEPITFVTPVVVGSRGPPVAHAPVQGYTTGNYVSLESQPVHRHAVPVRTVDQPRSVVTEVGTDKAVLDTYTHTEITLNRGDPDRAVLLEAEVHSG